MPAKEIAIAALIATSGVTDAESPKEKILFGGDMALVATERCVADGRDIYKGFTLISDYQDGYFKVNCQILETTTGDYYASKGVYYEYSENLDALIELFKERRK
ncbi:hypothetical protein AVO42_02930 [Thiomicrospira sp. XS5]|uniref:hypothetical protein n=1 Tax=Thiomicrospira sp. XS5 TaxID=1775636 RepID=UPI000749808B|nr:hypothetical protein [Thiomicrospira sp. XS5]KUJ74380.1 hypothetical protein AVO42_02930 [Thiomicrospira sp. XS5]